MKKTLVAATALASLLLVSCGTSSTDTASLTSYEGTGFTIDVPKAWIPVEAKELPIPKAGKVVLSLSSSEITSGFANNMIVLK